MKRYYIILIFFIFLFQFAIPVRSSEMTAQAVQKYIEFFRNEGKFSGVPQGVVVNAQIEDDTLIALKNGLKDGDQHVRKELVRLIKKLDEQTTGNRWGLLSDHKVISLLAIEGIAKIDVASDEAIGILRSRCTPYLLSIHNGNYTETLKRTPDDDLLLLIAKAKAVQAQPIVEQLLKTEKWKNNASAKIAAAALGNTKIENEYIAQATSARDEEALDDALDNLKLIGTRRSLQVAASFLRTPLRMKDRSETSLRLKVLEALSYNYPDKSFLYPDSIHSQEDYSRAEKFVADTLDVHFDGPLPQFHTYYPTPTPLP